MANVFDGTDSTEVHYNAYEADSIGKKRNWSSEKTEQFSKYLKGMHSDYGILAGDVAAKNRLADQWETGLDKVAAEGRQAELEHEQMALMEEQRAWMTFQRAEMERERADALAERDKITKEREEAKAREVSELKSRSRRRLALTETGSSGDLSTAKTSRGKLLGN